MKTFFAALGMIAMLFTGTVTTTSPAAADSIYRHGGYHGGGHHWRGDRGWRGDRHWRGGRNHWRGGRHYSGGRHWRGHRGYRGSDGWAAGAIGLGVGTIIGSALAAPRYYDNGYYRDGYIVNEGPAYPRYYRPVRRGYSHVEACYARYRSYDARSDTFIGYDGRAHRCRL